MINYHEQYGQRLSDAVYTQIEQELASEHIKNVVQKILVKAHITDVRSSKFQTYYFETLQNETGYFNSETFFKVFKQQYALQGVDNGYLGFLESNKREILQNIKNEDLVALYFSIFKKAKLKRKDSHIFSEQGSFFSKLVHTFKPNDYCALDNPVKEYFGLEKECFFQSFIAVSHAYKKWSEDNYRIVEEIRIEFQSSDVNGTIPHAKITNQKLLDMIFWSKADIKKKNK